MFDSKIYQYCVRSIRLQKEWNLNLWPLLNNSFHLESSHFVNAISKPNEANKCTNLVSTISNYFNVDIDTSQSIIERNKTLFVYKTIRIQKSLETCSNFNIDKAVLKNNLWLLKIRPDILQKKLEVVSKMNFKDINHGVPFLSQSASILKKIRERTSKESTLMPGDNLLYYLSEKLKMDPYKLAEVVATRYFVYNLPFERLQKSLDIILDHEVHPDNIIKDFWVLKYKPEIIQKRLETFQESGRKKMMPWMIKCSKDIFERSIDLTVTTKKILGNNNSSLNYLANRLNCSLDVVQKMCTRTTLLSKIRVPKLKNMLDFLFSVGFSEQDIISTPRVFPHSINTLKKKFFLLKSANVKEININSICLSNKDFKKRYHKKIFKNLK